MILKYTFISRHHTIYYRDLLAKVRSVTPNMSGSFQSLHLPGHHYVIMSHYYSLQSPDLSSWLAASVPPDCFSRP